MAKTHKRKLKPAARQMTPPTSHAPAFQAPPGGDQTLLNSNDVTASKCSQTSQRRQATDTEGVSWTAADSTPKSGSKAFQKWQADVKYRLPSSNTSAWDRDQDGQIYPWDTYTGFRELGFGVLFSLLTVLLINGCLSYPTRLAVSWWPDWVWWRVWVEGIHKAKHGSDSGVYDKEGGFVTEVFETLFGQ